MPWAKWVEQVVVGVVGDNVGLFQGIAPLCPESFLGTDTARPSIRRITIRGIPIPGRGFNGNTISSGDISQGGSLQKHPTLIQAVEVIVTIALSGKIIHEVGVSLALCGDGRTWAPEGEGGRVEVYPSASNPTNGGQGGKDGSVYLPEWLG